MAEHKFTAIETASTLSSMGVYQINNGEVTSTQLTGDTQLSNTGLTWGSFTNTTGIDTYHVYFFFSASSVVIDSTTGSTYTDPTGSASYTGCSVYDKIYHVNNTGLYAIRLDFPERYESTAGSETYTSSIVIKTNEAAVSMSKTITITHTYCSSAS